jgi:hypothetical protein
MRFGHWRHGEAFEAHEAARHDPAELPRLPATEVPAAEPQRDAARPPEDLVSVAGDRVERELFVRHARKDGRLVAVLRAVDHGASCVVEAEVYPLGSTQQARPGPYTFGDAQQASAFVTEAVTALMYLGCDIQAQ